MSVNLNTAPNDAAVEGFRVQGKRFFGTQCYDEAASAYTAALEHVAGDGSELELTLLNNRALAHYRNGAYSSCLMDSSRVLSVESDNAKALYRSGLAHLMCDEPQEALKKLRRLVNGPSASKAPSDANSLLVRAEVLIAHQALVHSIQQNTWQNTKEDGTDDEIEEPFTQELQDILDALWADVDGDSTDDIDVLSYLARLSANLTKSKVSRAYFEAKDGYKLLWFFVMLPAYCESSADVLHAASGPELSWPLNVWKRLATISLQNEEELYATTALKLLTSAAKECMWARSQFLVHPLALSDESENKVVPLRALCTALRAAGKSQVVFGSRKAKAIVDVLSLYATQCQTDVATLKNANCHPLESILTAFQEAQDIIGNTDENELPKAQAFNMESEGIAVMDEEEAARQALLSKLRAVYDVKVISLRRHLLNVFVQLSVHRDLVLAESVVDTGAGTAKPKSKGGPLVPLLLETLSDLVDKAPKRTAPVLGPDGYPAAYSKRPFAADWADNPTGDFLTGLDLNKNSSQEEDAGDVGTAPTKLTLLETFLETTLNACRSSKSVSTLMHRHGILDVCRELFKFLTPNVVETAQRLCALVSDSCPAASEVTLQAGSIAALVGVARYSENEKLRASALDRLGAQIDACSGDDFALLTGQHGILETSLQASQSTEHTNLAEAGKSVLRLSADRTLRCQGIPTSSSKRNGSITTKYKYCLPQGPEWQRLDHDTLVHVLGYVSIGEAMTTGLDHDRWAGDLKRGFLQATSSKKLQSTNVDSLHAAAPPIQHQGTQTREEAHLYDNGVVIEDITDVDGGRGSSTCQKNDHRDLQPGLSDENHTSEAHMEVQETPEEEAQSDLTVVFDSTPKDEGLRRARATWLALSPSDRIRWAQTSSDISVWICVPQGTRANEIEISFGATRLSVSLKWYGRIVDGDLHARIKAREATWCLESSSVDGDEVHVILPKDGGGQYWKALVQGGEERGYYELLKEAVHADEPAVPYDSMDSEAKDLLDSLLERQAYVNAGLIDLENGFDDFRVVIGEQSLGINGSTERKTQ